MMAERRKRRWEGLHFPWPPTLLNCPLVLPPICQGDLFFCRSAALDFLTSCFETCCVHVCVSVSASMGLRAYVSICLSEKKMRRNVAMSNSKNNSRRRKLTELVLPPNTKLHRLVYVFICYLFCGTHQCRWELVSQPIICPPTGSTPIHYLISFETSSKQRD